jgi:phosphatidylserine decarboxylase
MDTPIAILLVFLSLGVILLALVSKKWCFEPRTSVWLIGASTLIALTLGLVFRRYFDHWLAGFLSLVCQLGIYLTIVIYLFFRDPVRISPDDPRSVVSPADGKVIYIKHLEAGQVLISEKNKNILILDELRGERLTNRPLWHIGISMVFTDVHVNRSPISGQVKMVHRHSGQYLSLRKDEAVNVNERQILLIEKDDLQVAVVQIASRMVRRIQSFVQQGDLVERGQRIGVIKFGSQVDLLIPAESLPVLDIKLGHGLTAGETIIGYISK